MGSLKLKEAANVQRFCLHFLGAAVYRHGVPHLNIETYIMLYWEEINQNKTVTLQHVQVQVPRLAFFSTHTSDRDFTQTQIYKHTPVKG